MVKYRSNKAALLFFGISQGENRESLKTYTTIKDRPDYDKSYAMVSSKIAKELGRKPSATNEEGLKKIVSQD